MNAAILMPAGLLLVGTLIGFALLALARSFDAERIFIVAACACALVFLYSIVDRAGITTDSAVYGRVAGQEASKLLTDGLGDVSPGGIVLILVIVTVGYLATRK